MRNALAFGAFLLATACSHATLPGTNIPDSPQNRAVLDVFAKYRDALEARDPSALFALAAPTYYDAGDPTHSLAPTDYGSLQKKLQTDFGKVNGIKLEATVKDIEVKGDEAHLDYFQVLRYAVKTPSGETWKSESDDARMKFVRVDGQWKIVSGL
ncbi:MAG: nuclear transport factor 2 family protein [Myxococcales bacterium]|nr:nuclear transport factor 2 family protein [Myxococcales bacterium]